MHQSSMLLTHPSLGEAFRLGTERIGKERKKMRNRKQHDGIGEARKDEGLVVGAVEGSERGGKLAEPQ